MRKGRLTDNALRLLARYSRIPYEYLVKFRNAGVIDYAAARDMIDYHNALEAMKKDGKYHAIPRRYRERMKRGR